MPIRPESRPTRLADARVSPPAFVPATIIRAFAATELAAVEAAWAPVRQQLRLAYRLAGLDLENSHWDWAGKRDRVDRGELTLVALEAEGKIQGVMAIDSQPRSSVLTPGKELIYVDYLETAPWNHRFPGWPSRFVGIGRTLVSQAIQLSSEMGLMGRVGLHSLPQAEGFYLGTCRMTRIGPDLRYYDLVYFEYTEASSGNWLKSQGPSS